MTFLSAAIAARRAAIAADRKTGFTEQLANYKTDSPARQAHGGLDTTVAETFDGFATKNFLKATPLLPDAARRI